MKKVRGLRLVFPAIIVALSIGIYANTLPNEFTFDDDREIVNNPLIKSLDWRQIWLAYLPGPGKIPPPGRLASFIAFSLNYAAGGLNPIGYHLVNIILHACVSLLIYAVTLNLFPHRFRLSFLTGVFFACHPVHTEVVAAAVGRAELLAASCSLLAIRIYLRKTPFALSGRSGGYWLTVPLFVIGVFSKESALCLPFLIIGLDFYRFKIRAQKTVRRFLPVGRCRLKTLYLPYLLLLAVMLIVFSWMVPTTDEIGANFLVFLPFGERILAAFGILARYLALLAWPARLSADYSYAQLSHQSPAILALWTAGGIGALIGGTVLALVSSRRKGGCFLAVWIFAVNYAIVSNLILVINVSMAERLIYMSSWGFCLVLGLIFDGWIARRRREGKGTLLPWLLIAAILTAYSARTWIRNRDWQDNFALFSAAYKANPHGARVNYNLGLEYSERGDLGRALFHYEQAVRIIPWNPLYHLNLGEAYARNGDSDKAIDEFTEVVRLEPERSGGFINLAGAYAARGRADQAIRSLLIAREIDRDNWRIYFNLGDAYLIRRDIGPAAAAYERSLELNPDHWQAWNKLGAMRLELRDPEKAVTAFRRAIEVFPDCKEAYNNLGFIYAVSGEEEAAERAYRKALEIDPGFTKARNNLNRLLSE